MQTRTVRDTLQQASTTLNKKGLKMHIALAYNLRAQVPAVAGEQPSEPPDEPDDLYAEWDDLETIQAVAAALAEQHRVSLVSADLEAFEAFRELRPDLVFNIAEGLYGPGREGQIPALLDMLQIPYTGSDPVVLGLCLDKARTKEILAYHDEIGRASC